MKKINELISQTLNSESEAPSTGPQLTTGDRDLVNWFFMRLETNYGSKFWTQFSDEKTVLLTKREWAAQITQHSREELHIAIEGAKKQRTLGNDDFDWPDIAKILGLLVGGIAPRDKKGTGNSDAYLSIHDPRHSTNRDARTEYGESKHLRIDGPKYESNRKKAGKSALSAMKGMFKIKDKGE